MREIKETIKYFNNLLFKIIVHTGILWASLSLGYNSYKEYMSTLTPLSRVVKESIKSEFPTAIIIFLIIYIIILLKDKTDLLFLNTRLYTLIIIAYISLLNIFIYNSGLNIIIPLNISIIYLAMLLPLFNLFVKYIIIMKQEDLMKLQRWLPPVIYNSLSRNIPTVQSYVINQPFSSSIIIFATLIISGALLQVVNATTVTEHLANIAYFTLLAGVFREIYLTVKSG